MTFKTLSEAQLSGKTVLLRAGFDVPMDNGTIQDDTRLRAALPTIKYIMDQGAALIIMSHQGRPTEAREPEFSQRPVAAALEALLEKTVSFVPDVTGSAVTAAAEALQPGEILLLENLRYDPREKSKDPAQRAVLAQELADLADVYVNDAFPNCHRDHASMTGVPALLPSYLGLQLAEEVEHLSAVLNNPGSPLTLIVSGAKMETKVPVIEKFLTIGDHILIGGCIANTFIAALGRDVGQSKYDEEAVDIARSILEKAKDAKAMIQIPTDVMVAPGIDQPEKKQAVEIGTIASDQMIFDIGPATTDVYAQIIRQSQMVVWNGPLGLYEIDAFATSSRAVALALADATATSGVQSIIGGGDTLDLLDRCGMPDDAFTFKSTGGGAMLEFISGKELPALAALAG